MYNALRTFGNRGFANRELETEFTTAYRSHGPRFLFISSALVALYFLIFLLFDLISGRQTISESAQISRIGIIAGLTVFASATRTFRDFFVRHYAAPRRFVWKPTATIGGGRSAVWACGQVAERLVHMPMRPCSA
jgi:hypothetical protein